MSEDMGPILLGTIIGNADSGAMFPDGITETMFESSRDRIIFTTATEMIQEGMPPNLVLLGKRLVETGKVDKAGGYDYLAGLTSLPSTYASLIPKYGELLQQQAMDRKATQAILEAAEGLKNKSPGQVVPDLLNEISGYGNGKEQRLFQFIRLDSIELKPPSWIVDGLIEKDSFCCLYGDPGAGKSFIAIEIAACIVTGTPFHDIPVKQGSVIYMAGEGHSGLARRFKAWSIARGISMEGTPLYLSAGAIALIEPTTMGRICIALEKIIKQVGNPSLVIFDTWSRVLGGDDSTPSDAAAGVAALDNLRARFGNFAAMVVHHEGHAKGRGRGWSGLRAAVDGEFRAERGTDGILRLECTKAKDTGIMEPMAFEFSSVELPIRNESGQFVTSAVLNQVEWTPTPKTGSEPVMGKNQMLALGILKRLLSTGQVTLEAWREACLAEGMIRQRFNETKISLSNSNKIEINNLFVTVCERTNHTPLIGGVCRSVRCSTNGTDEKQNEIDNSFDSFGSEIKEPMEELVIW